MRQIMAVAFEGPFPFEDVMFFSQCPTAAEPYQLPYLIKDPPPPPDNVSFPSRIEHELDPSKLSICYVLLVHSHPEFALRLIKAILTPQHSIVIHVDRKAEPIYHQLKHWTKNMQNIIFVPIDECAFVNWGGYSVVNATLIGMHYALLYGGEFDYLADISGTSYPIKSNKVIAETLAKKKNAIYMSVTPFPSRPTSPEMWNHYIECDNAVHRVGRLPLPRGIDLFQGSQWFFLPRHVVYWIMTDSFPRDFVQYARRVVVSDETYFGTVLKNSPYCGDIEDRKNHVFVLFDRWENERNQDIAKRDTRKCLHPNPDHCGRSPMTLTVEFKRYVTMTKQLFARKFDPLNEDSMNLLNFVERLRNDEDGTLTGLYKLDYGDKVMILTKKPADRRERTKARGRNRSGDDEDGEDSGDNEHIGDGDDDSEDDDVHKEDASVDGGAEANVGGSCSVSDASCQLGGHEIITEETLEDYLCLEIMKSGHKLRLGKCEPSLPFQWFKIGPCTDNTDMIIPDGGCAQANPNTIQHDMLCQITSVSRNNQICIDVMGESVQTGSKVIAYECTGNWNQLFRLSTDCSLSVTQPDIVGHSKGEKDRTNTTVCIKSQPLEEKSGYELITDSCDGDAKGHQFKFLRKDGSLHKSIKSALNIAK